MGCPRFYVRDLWHPRSPLSSTSPAHKAFFCHTYPEFEVKKFESFMPEYESLLVFLGMMFYFVNMMRVLSNILVGKGACMES
jgi:hypothetical protein